MRLAVVLFILSQNAFASKLHDWWFYADAANLDHNHTKLENIKFGTCEISKSCWHIAADSALIYSNRAELVNPRIDFLGLKLPVFFKDLPLDGSGRSGFLWPRIGYDKLRGSYLDLPFYLWASKFHIGRIALQSSSKLGKLWQISENLLLDRLHLKLWLALAPQGQAWRLQAKSKTLAIDWSDTQNNDLSWLWRLNRLPVLQSRLERYVKLSFASSIGNVRLEAFSPKNVNSNFEPTLISDYHWLPRISWDFAKNTNLGWMSSLAQWTYFSLEKPLIGDLRPHSVHRLLLKQDLSNIANIAGLELYTKLGLHTVKDKYQGKDITASIPWAYVTVSKNINNLTTKLMLRAAGKADQSQLPILDAENLQQNISTWNSERYFAGNDRFSDIQSLGLSFNYKKDNWQALLGIRHNSSSHVCLETICAKPAENLLAFGFDYNDVFNSFIIYDKQGLGYINSTFNQITPLGKINLGYTKTNTTQHWFISISQKLSKSLDSTIMHAVQTTDNQRHNLSQVTLTKHLKCLDVNMFYKRDRVDLKNQSFVGLSASISS